MPPDDMPEARALRDLVFGPSDATSFPQAARRRERRNQSRRTGVLPRFIAALGRHTRRRSVHERLAAASCGRPEEFALMVEPDIPRISGVIAAFSPGRECRSGWSPSPKWREKSPFEPQLKDVQLQIVSPIPGEVLQVTLKDVVMPARNRHRSRQQPKTTDPGGGEEEEGLAGVVGLVGVQGVGPPA